MLETLQNLDASLLLAIQGMRLDWLNPLVEGFTAMGDAGLLWISVSLGLLCCKPTRKAGALSLLAMALGLLCTNVILKNLFARPRPWLDIAGLIPLVNERDPNSFPSGHTCAAFAAGLIWAGTLPKRGARALAMVLAVCMGLSRLYVGVHYPSDVLAGAAVGAFCAWAAWKLYGLWERRRTASARSGRGQN